MPIEAAQPNLVERATVTEADGERYNVTAFGDSAGSQRVIETRDEDGTFIQMLRERNEGDTQALDYLNES